MQSDSMYSDEKMICENCGHSLEAGRHDKYSAPDGYVLCRYKNCACEQPRLNK